MAITNKNFKLPKSVKRVMATIYDAHECGVYKRMMIEAIVHEQNAKFKKSRDIAAGDAIGGNESN